MILGIDMGGTHIDGVIISKGKIIDKVKRPTNRENLLETIWTTLESLLLGHDKKEIKRINLSTTVSTNAIVENKISPVGMIIQPGPGMNYEFLKCGQKSVFISGYVDHRGKLVDDLDEEQIKSIKTLFKNKNIDSCAIVTKFSTRNPSHEIRIKEILEEDFYPITMGHSLSGKLNFPRRVYSSFLNAAVYNTFDNFSSHIRKSLEKENIEAPLFILKADGGTMDIKTAKTKPVETILSGPAASFMGMKAMLPTNKDAILLDIGGTTTDIFFLADGVPIFEPLGIKINEYKTLVRAIYSSSIGLGGDSSISIQDKQIKIGPERKGYPMALGGPEPTPTDAMIVLGLMEEGDASKAKAYDAMERLGRKLDLSPQDISRKIMDTMGKIIKNKVDQLLLNINSQPVYTVKELLEGKTIQPKLINIIGGPAKVLAPILEKEFDLPTYYPRDYHVANAIGAALAKPTMEINMMADTERGILSVPELELYENIPNNFDLGDAKKRALELIRLKAREMGSNEDEIEGEIVEESSFNMVRGYFTSGKNIRVKAQIKPGLIHQLRSGNYDKS